MQRKESLANGEIYHITTKSIAGYEIFHSDDDYRRMIQAMRFFSYNHTLPRFTRFLDFTESQKGGFETVFYSRVRAEDKLIRMIAYCIMPTHIHFVVEQRKTNGISIAVGNILNAFARYFNVKHKRLGPLWAGKFKNIHVDSDEQLLHLTRYVHLNPVTAGIVDHATKWPYSSYSDYQKLKEQQHPLCDFGELIDLSPVEYEKFVHDHAGYQRELARIKHLVVD